MLNVCSLQGKRIPLTEKHISAGRVKPDENPVALAINEALGGDIIASVHLLSEEVHLIEPCNGKRKHKITLLTAGTLDEWLMQHDNGKAVSPGTLIIFKQDDEDDPDDRLWIGFEDMKKTMYPPNVIRAFNGTTGGLTVVDIDAGRDEDSGQFALRCALERITDLEVAVNDTSAEFYRNGEGVLRAILSQEIMDWTLDFDEGQPVAPIQLILREIDKQWGVYKTYAAQTPLTYHPIPESVEVLVAFENDEPFGTQWEGAIRENGRLDYVIDDGGRYFFTMEELYAHGVRRLYINNTYELNITIG